MEDLSYSLITFNEGTDVAVDEASAASLPAQPPIRSAFQSPALVIAPELEIEVPHIEDGTEPPPQPPRISRNEWFSLLLGPFVVFLTALIVYRLFF